MKKITRRQFGKGAAAATAATALWERPAAASLLRFHGGASAAPPPPSGTLTKALALTNDVIARSVFDNQAPFILTNTVVGIGNYPQQYIPLTGSYTPYAWQQTTASTSFPTTMTIVQDGTHQFSQATPTFGWPFQPGDIPAGHAPLFQASGVTWNYSAGLQTYWPDGSLKWAAFALVTPVTLQTYPLIITISDGGPGWPAASGFALSDVYAANLILNMKTPSPAIPGNGRSVDLVASPNGDTRQVYAVKDMDGAAGARWTIYCFAQQSLPNGTADTEVLVTFRVFVMKNGSGGLAGYRWFGEIRNPLYKTSSTNYIVFQPPSTGSPATGLNWQTVGPGGSGTVNNPVWFPFNTVNYNNGTTFTGAVSGSVLTVSSAPSSFVMAAANANISAVPGGPPVFGWIVTINSIDRPFVPDAGGANTLLTVPGGITVSGGGPGTSNGMFGLSSQNSTGIPNQYYTDNASFSASFTNQNVIISSTLPPYYGTVGLDNGGPILAVAVFHTTSIVGTTMTVSSVTLGPLRNGLVITGDGVSSGTQIVTQLTGPTGGAGTYQITPSQNQGEGDMSAAVTYQIIGQLTSTDSDVGLKGTYLLSSSPGTIGSSTMNYYGGVSCQTDDNLNWYSGSGNVVPGILTGGSLPPFPGGTFPAGGPPVATGLNGGMLFATTLGGQSFALGQYYNPGININNPFTGPGHGTFTPAPGFCANSRFQIATKDAKYNFFQGAGSATADSTLRTQINQAYWQASGVIPPMIMPSSSLYVTIPDTGYKYDWNPYNCLVCRSTGVDNMGPPWETASWGPAAGADFYVQSFLTDKENRILGLYLGTTASDAKVAVSGVPRNPPLYGTGTPYTGLPAALMGAQVPGNSGIATQINNPTHQPEAMYWPYLRTGELQYLDYMVDWAQFCASYQQWTNSPPLSAPPAPYTTFGNVMQQGQERGCGWSNFNIQRAAFICSNDPTHNGANPVFNDGSQLQQYLLDWADDQPRMMVEMATGNNATLWGSSASAAYMAANPGAWGPNYNNVTGGIAQYNSWEMGYLYGALPYALLRGNAFARIAMANYIALIDHLANHSALQQGTVPGGNGYLFFYNHDATNWIDIIGRTAGVQHGNASMAEDTDFGLGNFASGQITGWVNNSGGGNAFTATISCKGPWYNQSNTYTPQNDDAVRIIINGGIVPINDSSQWPAELSLNAVYYVRNIVNTSGNIFTFNLSATRGGSAIVINTTNSSPQIVSWDIGNYTPAVIDQNDSFGPDYIHQMSNPFFWLCAIAQNSKLNAIAGIT